MTAPPTDDDLARARTNLAQARAWTPSNDRDRRARARNIAQLEAWISAYTAASRDAHPARRHP